MQRSLLISCALPALLAGCYTTVAVAADAPQGPAGAAAPTDKGNAIADIVVTATRRSEKLQNVPVTVEAIGGEQLRQQGITDFAQLVQQLPEVHSGGRGPGQNVITIRGLSVAQISLQASAVAGPDPNVAVYIDDASVALPGRNLDVYAADLDRVEVLEGPQGTLFGSSAEGGAIRYITAKPVLSGFHAGVTMSGAITPGHEMSESVQGYVNIPIIQDRLAVRLVGFVDRQGGYIDNVEATYQMPLVGYNADHSVAFQLPADATRPIINNAAFAKNDFNPATYSGGRISLKWQVAPDWMVEVQDMYQTLDAEGVFQYDPTLGDLKVARFSPDYNHDKFNQVQWNVEGKLGKLGLIYTGSYLDRKVAQKFDYTHYASVGPYAPYYICKYPGYHSCATPRMTYIDNERNTRLTQEFRIATPKEYFLRLQAGVYYDDTKLYEDNTWYYEGAAQVGFNGQPPAGTLQVDPSVRPAGGVYFNDAIRSESQIAVFGEGNWDIFSNLTLTAGARYYDQKIGLEGSVNCGILGPTLPQGHACAHGNYAVSLAGKSPAHEHGVTPKFTLSWKPDRDIMVYTTYSEGFRPGGFNRNGGTGKGFTIPYTYQSDGLKNYEIGWKTQFFNHSLQWNGSAYWIDWSNIPTAIYAPAIANSTFDLNGPSARVKGFTNDIVWRATHEFTFTGNVTYNHSALTKYGSTPVAFQPQPGDSPYALTLVPLGSPLALSPEWQGAVRIRYEHPVSEAATFFAEYGAQFVGHSYTQDIKATNQLLPGYTMMDASAGVREAQWTAQMFVQNLADARPKLYINADDNIPLTSTSRPRTIGIRVNYNY